MFGLRYHCWVLVLAGKREVAQSFFIEPTTGETLPLDTDQYLGVETMWNHKNYWVNMQDCSEGVKTLVYDLGDASKWEYFFPNVDKHLLLPDEENKLGEDEVLCVAYRKGNTLYVHGSYLSVYMYILHVLYIQWNLLFWTLQNSDISILWFSPRILPTPYKLT